MAVDCPHSWYRRPRLADAEEYPDLSESASRVTPPAAAPDGADTGNADVEFRSMASAHGILTGSSSSEDEDPTESTVTTVVLPVLSSQGLLVPQQSESKQPVMSRSDEVLANLFASDDDEAESAPMIVVNIEDNANDADDGNDVDDDEMGDSATMPESLPHSAALRKSSIPTLVTTRKKT